jgi:hypothetical protein
LTDFPGIENIVFNKKYLKGILTLLGDNTLRKIRTLTSLHENQFEIYPTIPLPDFSQRFARRAYNKIIGKRERQNFTFETTDEIFQIQVGDD